MIIFVLFRNPTEIKCYQATQRITWKHNRGDRICTAGKFRFYSTHRFRQVFSNTSSPKFRCVSGSREGGCTYFTHAFVRLFALFNSSCLFLEPCTNSWTTYPWLKLFGEASNTSNFEAEWRMHMCFSKFSIGSDNGLSPVRHQTIMWICTGLIRHFRNKFRWNFNRTTTNFIRDTEFKNVSFKIVVFLSRHKCPNLAYMYGTFNVHTYI